MAQTRVPSIHGPSPPSRAAPAPASQEETAAKSAIAPCYREALAREAKVGRSLTFAISVDGDGSVRSLSSKYDVPDELAACATAHMQRVVFPPSKETRPRLFVVPMLFRDR